MRKWTVPILSLFLSLALHAGALELMIVWPAGGTIPPGLRLTSGENGSGAHLVSLRPPPSRSVVPPLEPASLLPEPPQAPIPTPLPPASLQDPLEIKAALPLPLALV